MLIRYTSPSRPERLTKDLHRALNQHGHATGLCQVREATAQALGYRTWNDLRAQSTPRSGQAALVADPDAASDHAVGTRLAARLGIPDDLGTRLVAEVGLTAPQRTRDFCWTRRLSVLAARMTGSAETITPVTIDHRTGFRLEPKSQSGLMRSITLTVGDDGSVSLLRNDKPRVSECDGQLGSILDAFGLLDGRPYPGRADPTIIATLTRLDGRAIMRLRADDLFDIAAYDAIRLNPDTPFARLLDRIPLIGCRVRQAVGDADNFLEKSLLSSDDPEEDLLREAVEFSQHNWPEWPYDRMRARRVLTVFRDYQPSERDRPFGCWTIAFLNACPEQHLPEDPPAIQACIAVASKLDDLFYPSTSIGPSQFYEDFSGDWIALNRSLRSEYRLTSVTPFEDLAIDCLDAAENARGIRGKSIDHDLCAMVVDERLRPVIVKGRSYRELCQAGQAYDAVSEPLETAEGRFAALMQSPLLPSDYRTGSAADLLHKIGFDLDRLLKARRDSREISLGELRAYVVRDDAPAIPRHVTDDDNTTLGGDTVFYRFTLGSITLDAHVGRSGLYLNEPERLESIALGDCTEITDCIPDKPGYWLAKRGSDPCIHLGDLDPSDLHAIKSAFGFAADPVFSRIRPVLFDASPAGDGLRAWIRAHPRKAAAAKHCREYLGNWYDRLRPTAIRAKPKLTVV